MPQNNNKEFWVQLGMDLGKSIESSQRTEGKLDRFISNDFKHLSNKVDKIATKVAVIMGVIGFVWILVQIGLKIIPLIKDIG